MRYASIKYNDASNTPGICVSIYVQGCIKHCKNCFNPETWDFDGGKLFTLDVMKTIIDRINENGVDRKLAILGGEPLQDPNIFGVCEIVSTVKLFFPEKPIYIWTGRTLEELEKHNHPVINNILSMTDYLIDGPYIDELRDITLQMRGSSNQRIWDLKNRKILDKF